MTDTDTQVPPFPAGYRASGILLHVTSLPSPYGIGDLGPAAMSWVERLALAGQSWWQTLPLGPTGIGNSPYTPLSSAAANPLLISPDWLVEEELVALTDTAHPPFPAGAVDYDRVIPFKRKLLETVWRNFGNGARSDLRDEYGRFCKEQDHWLTDYTLFAALKHKFSEVHYLQWPAELVRREPATLDRVRRELADPIGQESFTQFLLFRLIQRLKEHAHKHRVRLIGDLPFFVSDDSSDVWANPELFLLDAELKPRFVAGVPPDYFSKDGQLWGNPVYDWDRLRSSGYRWWIDRLRSTLAQVDAVRVDHFRGFAAAWYVRAGSATAKNGKWVTGPDANLWQAAEQDLGHLPFIAEDLGLITPDVYALRDQFHFPGMRVLQFAFDGKPDNPYLPENYVENAVVYTGTHDNPPTRSWFQELTAKQQEDIWSYLRKRGAKSREPAPALLEVGWSSSAGLAMAPLQDLLDLGDEARMNVPGEPDGNWRWRCTEEMLSSPAFEWLRELSKNTKRMDP
jgi:4-alpha-glucanotransferase